MNIESGAGSALVQRLERLGGAISPRELAWKLRRSNGSVMPMLGAIGGFE